MATLKLREWLLKTCLFVGILYASCTAIVQRLTAELIQWEQRMNVQQYSGVQ